MTDETNKLTGASSIEQELYTHLVEHVQNEREVLERYAAAADATYSHALTYLVQLLIEDERRHHMLFNELADSLRHDAEFHSGDPAIPRMDFDRVDSTAVRKLTDELLERELEDKKELKKLQKDLPRHQGHHALVAPGRADAARHGQAHRDAPLRAAPHVAAPCGSSRPSPPDGRSTWPTPTPDR